MRKFKQEHHAVLLPDGKLLHRCRTLDLARRETKLLNEAVRSELSSQYRVGKNKDGRPVIMLRRYNIVVAEFADNTKSAVDFFTEVLGK